MSQGHGLFLLPWPFKGTESLLQIVGIQLGGGGALWPVKQRSRSWVAKDFVPVSLRGCGEEETLLLVPNIRLLCECQMLGED